MEDKEIKADSLCEALKNIQSLLKAPKNQFNKFGGYKYRSAEDILEAVKPLLFSTKCVLTISDEIIMIGDRFYVKATAVLQNDSESISTSAFAREDDTKKGMDGSQITGSASSYARKYALNGLFAIDDTKDADATNTHGKEAETKEEKLLKVPERISDIGEALKAMANYKKYEGGFKAVWNVIDQKLKSDNDVTNSAKEICAKIKKDGKA